MHVDGRWLLLGLALVGGLAWWASREPDGEERAEARRQRAEHAAAQLAEGARPVLYRWRDADGVLHVTDTPPRHRRYERVPLAAPAAVEVHGDRR